MHAFYLCKSLLYIDIPGTVEDIGTDAFSGCESLQSVNI